MLWSEIKKNINEWLEEEELEDVVFSHMCIYDSATKLDIYFSLDGMVCVEGKKEGGK